MVDYPNRTKRQAPCCLNFLFLVEESSRVESSRIQSRYATLSIRVCRGESPAVILSAPGQAAPSGFRVVQCSFMFTSCKLRQSQQRRGPLRIVGIVLYCNCMYMGIYKGPRRTGADKTHACRCGSLGTAVAAAAASPSPSLSPSPNKTP